MFKMLTQAVMWKSTTSSFDIQLHHLFDHMDALMNSLISGRLVFTKFLTLGVINN